MPERSKAIGTYSLETLTQAGYGGTRALGQQPRELFLILREERDKDEEPMAGDPAYDSLVEMNREMVRIQAGAGSGAVICAKTNVRKSVACGLRHYNLHMVQARLYVGLLFISHFTASFI